MNSNLKQGFVLPFAVALIAIFTILFGSIVTTTSFYIKQKQIASERMQLNLLAMIGLSKFYLSNPDCDELEKAVTKYTNTLCGPGFEGIHDPSESDESLFYQCHKENNLVTQIDSCAVSKKFSMIMKYSINLTEPKIFKSLD